MDADHADDLSELECRLSAWQPASEGLDSDAMLFAAGLAAALPRRLTFIWPGLASFMTVAAIVFGVGLALERDEKQMLAQQLRQHLTVQSPAPVPAPSSGEMPMVVSSQDEPSPDSYLAAHRALEHGLDAWPPRMIARADPAVSTSLSPHVFRVGQRDALLDQ